MNDPINHERGKGTDQRDGLNHPYNTNYPNKTTVDVKVFLYIRQLCLVQSSIFSCLWGRYCIVDFAVKQELKY